MSSPSLHWTISCTPMHTYIQLVYHQDMSVCLSPLYLYLSLSLSFSRFQGNQSHQPKGSQVSHDSAWQPYDNFMNRLSPSLHKTVARIENCCKEGTHKFIELCDGMIAFNPVNMNRNVILFHLFFGFSFLEINSHSHYGTVKKSH